MLIVDADGQHDPADATRLVAYLDAYDLVVGSLRQIRAYAYAHRPDPRPVYRFAANRQHWWEWNATDTGMPMAGALRVRVRRLHALLPIAHRAVLVTQAAVVGVAIALAFGATA